MPSFELFDASADQFVSDKIHKGAPRFEIQVRPLYDDLHAGQNIWLRTRDPHLRIAD